MPLPTLLERFMGRMWRIMHPAVTLLGMTVVVFAVAPSGGSSARIFGGKSCGEEISAATVATSFSA